MSKKKGPEAEPEDDEELGIECPKCGCVDLEVLRTTRGAGFRRRQRQCLNESCGYSRIFTVETTVSNSKDES